MQFRLELWSEFFFDWWSYSQPSSSNWSPGRRTSAFRGYSMWGNSPIALFIIPTQLRHIQAYIELASLEEVMELYLSEESLSNFGSCREYLSEWDVEADDRWTSRVIELCTKHFIGCIVTNIPKHSLHSPPHTHAVYTKQWMNSRRKPSFNFVASEWWPAAQRQRWKIQESSVNRRSHPRRRSQYLSLGSLQKRKSSLPKRNSRLAEKNVVLRMNLRKSKNINQCQKALISTFLPSHRITLCYNWFVCLS